MKFDAMIFDFDGVLLESEFAGNRQIADYLTSIGHPTSAADSMANFMGLAGADFLLGERTPRGADTYVLCEINVSSVFPIPDESVAPLVTWTLDQAVSRVDRAHTIA